MNILNIIGFVTLGLVVAGFLVGFLVALFLDLVWHAFDNPYLTICENHRRWREEGRSMQQAKKAAQKARWAAQDAERDRRAGVEANDWRDRQRNRGGSP